MRELELLTRSIGEEEPEKIKDLFPVSCQICIIKYNSIIANDIRAEPFLPYLLLSSVQSTKLNHPYSSSATFVKKQSISSFTSHVYLI